ncbi:MAG: GGDEF domain-containing protein [Eubacteriales bacterium]|nr:GGDEF domain-containing protein [Eubacteriales bacterium]
MKQKSIKSKIMIYMVLFLCIAIVIETAILSYANKKQVKRTSQILLDQVENILIANDQNEQDILESLKVEYTESANTVSYILEYNEEAQDDIEELQKIADMMGIDEIHLFDENGVIYGGTVPAYYGLTFDSGEQVGFFKPMLEDKHLTMCQDVTPNTAASKSMMYAITWNKAGTYMVQVGIEPVRLLEEFKQNSIHEVVNQMTVYDGMNIYIADVETGEILGATDKSSIGRTAYEIGFLDDKDNLQTIESKTVNLVGYKHFCNYRIYDSYIIAVVHSTSANVESFIVSIGIEVIWLLVAGAIITVTLFKLVNANKRIKDQMSILTSVSDIYYSMHLIDMNDYSIETLEGNELMQNVVKQGQNAADMLNTIIHGAIIEEYLIPSLEFVDLSTLQERLKNKKSVFMDAIDKNVGWIRMSFITVETDINQALTKVLLTTQIIDDDKKREEELSYKANRDEMTGLMNRQAYEDDMMNFPDVPPEQNFVYAAIDINGLKVVNDELGHAAGDELIKGAAMCFKRTIGNYGRIYRTGGDEFVAMFFVDADHIDEVINDLNNEAINWVGTQVDALSFSIGYATKQEFPNETVVEIAKIADERMYKDKEQYYSKKGVDRRGQAAAHTALCNLYTKILKINLTEDTYGIINMDIAEQTKEKGFSNKISEWLYEFGKTGQVHEDDLEDYLEKTNIEYLKKYFKDDKTSISIHYRRKYEDGFKQVVMELIPANDYSTENQSLFLYVKNIDK